MLVDRRLGMNNLKATLPAAMIARHIFTATMHELNDDDLRSVKIESATVCP